MDTDTLNLRRYVSLFSNTALLAPLLLLTTSTTWAFFTIDQTQKPPHLSINILAMEYPGFNEKTAEHPEGTGIGVDISRAAFAAAGVDVTFEFVPIARAIQHMLRGKRQVLLGNNGYMPKKVRDRHFKLSLFPVNSVLFFHKKHFDASNTTMDRALSEHTIVTSFAPKIFYKDSKKIKTIPSPRGVVNVIIADNAKLGVLPWLTVMCLVKRHHPTEVDNMAFFTPTIMREWPGIIIDKTFSNSPELIEKMKIGSETIKSNGVQQAIYDRYWPNRAKLRALLDVEPTNWNVSSDRKYHDNLIER